MAFCRHCGAETQRVVPEGDNRPRECCGRCGRVHYDNPRVVTGCIVEQAGRVLLCRRAIEPRCGYWTLPAGFLELGESTAEGAARETLEEARAEVEVIAPYAYFDIPAIGQMHVFFRARMLAPGYGETPESSEVGFFGLDEIPWEALSFPVVGFSLRRFVQEFPGGRFTVEHGVVTRDAAGGFSLTPSARDPR